VGRLVRLADESGVDVFDLPVAELQSLSPALDEGFYALRDPLASLRAKRSRGGCAPSACASSSPRPRLCSRSVFLPLSGGGRAAPTRSCLRAATAG
jgi:hypothetical protein